MTNLKKSIYVNKNKGINSIFTIMVPKTTTRKNRFALKYKVAIILNLLNLI